MDRTESFVCCVRPYRDKDGATEYLRLLFAEGLLESKTGTLYLCPKGVLHRQKTPLNNVGSACSRSMTVATTKRLSLVRQLDRDVGAVEHAFVEALGENRATLPLSFERRQQAFNRLADSVEAFASDSLWRSHPLAAEMYEHAQNLRIACADENATVLDIEWLLHLRRLMPLVSRELARQLLADPAEAALYLLEELRGGDTTALRSILGVSLRALRAWLDQSRSPRGLDPERLVLTAQLVFELNRTRDRDQVIKWFTMPTDEPGLPLALLANPRENSGQLLAAASL